MEKKNSIVNRNLCENDDDVCHISIGYDGGHALRPNRHCSDGA